MCTKFENWTFFDNSTLLLMPSCLAYSWRWVFRIEIQSLVQSVVYKIKVLLHSGDQNGWLWSMMTDKHLFKHSDDRFDISIVNETWIQKYHWSIRKSRAYDSESERNSFTSEYRVGEHWATLLSSSCDISLNFAKSFYC